MKINWSKEIREIIESSHCRYCGRLSEKHGDKCRWDVDVAVEEIESLLSKQLEQHAMKMAGILAQADQKLTIYRADLLEKVEGLKKKDNLHPELDEFGKNCECYDCSSRDGFNYALDQVLSLLKGDV